MSCSCSISKDVSSAEILAKLLANTYVLYLKTQNVHWNVKGGSFREVHLMTEEHYNDLALAVDAIAERIRMVGGTSPATFEEFSKMSCVSDKLEAKTADEMLQALLEDHKTMVAGLKKMIGLLEKSDDFGTIDILTGRLQFHEKTVWMLTSTLSK